MQLAVAIAPKGLNWEAWRKSDNIEDDRVGNADLPVRAVPQRGIKKKAGGVFSAPETWADDWWKGQDTIDRFMGWKAQDTTGSIDAIEAFMKSDEFKNAETPVTIDGLTPEETAILKERFRQWMKTKDN